MVFLIGSRNVYFVLWKQKLYKSYFLLSIYILGLIVCALRIVQYMMFFFSVKKSYKDGFCQMSYEYLIRNKDVQEEIFWTDNQWRIAAMLTMYCTQFKLALGCI